MTLTPKQLERLIQGAVAAGLFGRDVRALLLQGYPPQWRAALPEYGQPGDQARSDLATLNAQPIDGRPGLALWLANARGRSAHPIVLEALTALGLSVPPPPVAPPAQGEGDSIHIDAVSDHAIGVNYGTIVMNGPAAPAVPGAPHFVDTRRMPQGTGDFVGRAAELSSLTTALNDAALGVRSVVAWGGVGKTALVRRWLDGVQGPRVYVWSFYSQGAGDDRQTSSDLFFQTALLKFGDPDPQAGDLWDRADRLAALINQAPTVLVLDGVEPLQHPPGPMAGVLKDPGLRALLHGLADRMDGLCLVTTRQPVVDLVDRAGFVETALPPLEEDVGVALLRAKGVVGDDAALATAVAEFAGHALALTLLGNLLRVYAEGDVRQRDAIPALTDDEQAGGHARRVMLAYEGRLASAEVAILRMLGLFDRPAELRVLDALRAPPIAGLSDAVGVDRRVWKKALDHLATLGLVAVRGDALDAHPLVREHFAERVQATAPAAWTEAHERLYRHFAADAPDLPDTLTAMEPLFRAVVHGCAAGRYQEVLDAVYYRRIQRDGATNFTCKQLGAFAADLATLAGFFATPWTRPHPALTPADQSVALNFAGFRLRAVGRLTQAVAPMEAGLQASVDQDDWRGAAIEAGNLSELLLTTGHLAAAEARAAEAVAHADRSGDGFQRTGKRATHADALHQRGALDAASNLFAAAEALQVEQQPGYPLLYSMRGYRYGDLWLSRGQPAEARRRAERFLEWRVPSDSLLDIAHDHLLLGRAALALDDHATSTEQLDHAVRGLRRAGEQEFIALGLLARAALRRVVGDYPAAARDLAEARRIVERGGMRLFLADVHLEAARLHLARAERDAARAEFEAARGLVDEMGYHRRDAEVAALAAALDGEPP